MDKYPRYYLYSAVQTEVITLAEAKMAIKIDSTNFEDNITVTSCVTGGYHAITASATGSGISVHGKKTLVVLEPVALSAGATLDVKIQESLDNVIYTDWSGGSFTQVTTANDTVFQEKEYTGAYQYSRVAYTIVSAQASFSVVYVLSEPTSVEDDYITDLITASREYAEEITNRAIGSQKWQMIVNDYPSNNDQIELPFPPLTEIESITHRASDGVSAVMSASESNGYIVDTKSEPGRIFLSYGSMWPSYTPYPYNGVEILFTCGYTSSNCPKKIKDAMLKMIGLLNRNRETGVPKEDLQCIDNLLRGTKVYKFG